MANLNISINLDNAAFNYFDKEDQIQHCLNQVSYQMRRNELEAGIIRDVNGNTVGQWSITNE